VRLVDLAFVAALDQAHLRHGGTGARSHDQHGVGVGRGQLQGQRDEIDKNNPSEDR
jgi:hypothetical protein